MADRHDAFNGDMIFSGSVNLCADQGQRILAACSNVISAAADLKNAVLACIYRAEVKVCALDDFAGLYFTDNDLADVLAYFILFLYLETAAEELFFENVRGNVNIYIILKPA